MSEFLSYKYILDDIKNFKKAGGAVENGTNNDLSFNIYDMPSHKYFKILFYFGSTPEMFSADSASGLLAPTWEYFNKSNNKIDYYNYNSAWAYLKMNNEEERAEKLEQFVTLLSDISSYSPWYFSSVGGISEALERKVTEDGKLEMNEAKKLTITCLPDSFDNRISTLLELYRDITWSWVHKREIIPANLKKFDMAIYIFESAINNMHKDTDVVATENGYNVSYKMIEFHDCEFNYNSIKSGWSELNNETGFSPKYTIDISYNDCYEISYNEFMMRKIGDVILSDLLNNAQESQYISEAQNDNKQAETELLSRTWSKFNDIDTNENEKNKNKIIYFGNLKDRTGKSVANIIEHEKYEYKQGFLTNAVGQVAGHFVKDVKSLFTKAVLGNLHTYSLTQIGDQINDLMQGNLIKSGISAAEYIKQAKQRKEIQNKEKPTGDIFQEENSTVTRPDGNIYPTQNTRIEKPTGDIFPNVVIKKSKPIGNIFSKSTLANNL